MKCAHNAFPKDLRSLGCQEDISEKMTKKRLLKIRDAVPAWDNVAKADRA